MSDWLKPFGMLMATLLALLALDELAVGQAIHHLPDVSDPLTRAYCDQVTESCIACQQGDCCLPHSAPHTESPRPIGERNWTKGAWQITPYGFLSAEMIASDAPLTARPFVLYVENDLGTDEKQFTVHGQTTALGVDFKGPAVGSLQAGGNVLFNFLGSRPVLNQSTPFLLRAYGDLKNENWQIGFGVAPDIFGALTPATVIFGGNIQSGNIAAFRGQFRVERYLQRDDDVRWTIISALSQQVVSDFVANPTAVGTDNGWPNVEGRIQVEIGRTANAEASIQLGTSGVIGETRAIDLIGRSVSTTWGLSADCQFIHGPVGFRCEVFRPLDLGSGQWQRCTYRLLYHPSPRLADSPKSGTSRWTA